MGTHPVVFYKIEPGLGIWFTSSVTSFSFYNENLTKKTISRLFENIYLKAGDKKTVIFADRIIVAYGFDPASIPSFATVCHNNSIERFFLSAHTSHSNGCHSISLKIFKYGNYIDNFFV